MGPGDLARIVAPLSGTTGAQAHVLLGPEAADDAGVYLLDGKGLVATVDFITPVCDDPFRFGRVAAANSVSDVYAMGGRPLFALNVSCFPSMLPPDVGTAILEGGASVLREVDAALLGGHTVQDRELKFGMAVIGVADPQRLLTHKGAQPGDRLILTKPVGTGVLINAFKGGKLDEPGLEPALVQMERLNARAAELALAHQAHAATDITGFGLAGHALAIARSSGVGLRLTFERIPTYERFAELVRQGVSTGATDDNRAAAEGLFEDRAGLDPVQQELLFDPQTSGGLLLSIPAGWAPALLRELAASDHIAADIGEVVPGPAVLSVI